MTGFTEMIEAQEAYGLGANEFLPKPFHRSELSTMIKRVLGGREPNPEKQEIFCRLGIDDFASGRKIKFGIYIRVADDRFIKVAHKGEDITPDRIKAYKKKGLAFLFLRQDDFRQYVGFVAEPGFELKSDAARATSMDLLTDDSRAMDMLNRLRSHSDQVMTHSLGVSVYSVLIGQRIQWNLPTNRFKLAIGGLLHDIGQQEISQHLLATPEADWSDGDREDYQSHCMLGYDMLGDMKSIPEDVRMIVKQHHENCQAKGFPYQVKKTAIHPMAKLISVADEFCYRVVRADGISPMAALQEMTANCSDLLDKEFMGALVALFKPAEL